MTGKFLCRNKYYGRKLGVDGFREGLYEFLNNGIRLRTDAIVPLIEKLIELKAVLSNLDTFRFYTSSLLLIYEGLDPLLDGDDCEVSTIKMEDDIQDSQPTDLISMDTIDDNAVVLPPKSIPETSKSVDDFTSAKFNDHDENSTAALLQGVSVSTEGLHNSATTPSASNRSSRSNLHSSRASTPSATSLSAESVDVRLIDFAHATHSGLDLGHCSKKHAGPDAGFILGLSNLIKVLEEILEQEQP